MARDYYEGQRGSCKLRRGRGLVFGLCEGLGRWIGIAPWIFRVIFIIMMFSWGFFQTAGVYVLASILIPSAY